MKREMEKINILKLNMRTKFNFMEIEKIAERSR